MSPPVLRLQAWLAMSHLVVLMLPVGALLATGALANDLRAQTREDLEHQAWLVAAHVSLELQGGAGPIERLPLSPFLREAKAATLAGFRVVNANGVVVASSGDGLGEDVSDDREVAEALDGHVGTEVRARPAGRSRMQPLSSESRRADVRIFVASPVRVDGEVVGAVLLSRTPREELQALWQMAPRLWGGLAVALAGTLGLAIAAGRILSRSLEALAGASERIATGGDAEPELARAAASHVAEARALGAAMSRMRARLRDRVRYISEFAGNVSHEFKTPVSALRGTVELLRDDDAMPPEQRARFLDNALADLDRLSRLVSGLLRLARADEGGGREPVDLDELAAGVGARYPGVTIRAGAGRVDANREQLEASLTNLVENARLHGGTNVRVEGWSDDAWTGLDVLDDGPGISPANLRQVFDRFFTTARGSGGTGLGLALVRAVAEAHGGRAEVESAPGCTRFRIALPRREPPRRTASPRAL